jgi:hypothetical protein
MKIKHIVKTLQNKELNTQTTVAIVAGVAIGVAIGALFATKKGRDMKSTLVDYANGFINKLTGNTPANAQARLGNLIGDVRSHIKLNAEGLLGKEYMMKDPLV